MKNLIIRIMALLAVMAAMTGIAASTSVDIDTQNPVDFIFNPLNGDTTTKDVLVSGMNMPVTGSRWIGVMSDNPNLYARLYGPLPCTPPACGIDITSNGNWVGFARSVSASTTQQTFNIEVWGTEFGYIAVQENPGNTQETNTLLFARRSVGVGSSEVNIPEFATVAIPIAAVLGLVFFFQQKKNKKE